ncbi:MAG: M23 family metallopeptidase [Bacteroidales bacterium]|nr:M23 family metallopeptidase [Bacteroidales bacterium]
MSKFGGYILNPETLLYEMTEVSWKSRLLKGLVLVLSSVAMSLLYAWIYVGVLGNDLPKTALLKKANARWNSKVELMGRRLDKVEYALETLEFRDDGIYRPLFGMKPIPAGERDAMYGGPGKYPDLEALPGSNALKTTLARLDRLSGGTYVQSRSFDEVAAIARRAGDMVSCIPAIPPINPDPSKYTLTSPFGYRSDPVYGSTAFHSGLDFAMSPGNPVYATGDGVVEMVAFEFYGYGNCVIINHGFGYKTRYAHMRDISVVEGLKVKRGDYLGESGKSGKVTGPHLHYEVIYMDSPVNPINYMDLEMSPKDYAAMVRGRRGEDVSASNLQPFSLRKRK